MSKKNKQKKQNTTNYQNDSTAFTKSDWYGKSRKSRSQRNKNKGQSWTKHKQNKNNMSYATPIDAEDIREIIKNSEK